MADLGPGRYDIPDDWKNAAKPVCGVVRPSSFMMSKSAKSVPIKQAVGQEGFDNSSTELDGDVPINAMTPIDAPRRHTSRLRASTRNGFSFPRGAKNALDDIGPADLPVYHIRVREITTGRPCIIVVNSLTELPEGYVNQETWANENMDGGVSLILKKEPLPPLNPLDQDIDASVPDLALVPMPVTPLKKSKPCSPIQVQQLHLTTGTDLLVLSPDQSSNPRAGFFLPTATHSLQSSNSPAQQSMFDLNTSEHDPSGVVDWNHPIAKLHIPTLTNNKLNQSATAATAARPKTYGQKLHEKSLQNMKPPGRQSEEPFSSITNRTRPDGQKFKKIPMHIADVASVNPNSDNLTGSEFCFANRSSNSLREDSLGARQVSKKLKGSVLHAASTNNSTLLNSLSELHF